MSTKQEYVYELMGADANHMGLFDTLEAARDAAKSLNNGEVQVNRIPMNKISYFGENFDCVAQGWWGDWIVSIPDN